jgi:hypothetical protein
LDSIFNLNLNHMNIFKLILFLPFVLR